ncbi:FAD binding domain protein [Aspergillus terreus]|uniref:FAD binding domain protein n=1 Tax=Aspergillus terreus TaxID=33178 RepID=A0A5M3YUY4_ASPTE|nr:hypothetical protein ATETN484_0002088700 [Aspergillus terreus]GFF15743.1 FAD binding domain protein [Aspergillus terreus]
MHDTFVQRSGLLDLLYQTAKDCGVDLRFGVKVTGYWESEDGAGIRLENGDKVAADCVIAADGIHSRARDIITGEEPVPHETGAAIYRSHFAADIIAGTLGKGKYVFWALPHRDVEGLSEVWLQPADALRASECVKDWPIGKKTTAILSRTPPGSCWNHLLVSRRPLSTWVSKGGRMVVIGDAAHPMPPNLGQGANQAIEDAAVLAICLELSGKGNIPLGLRVMQELRHKRVSVIQNAAIDEMEKSFRANWDADQTEAKPNHVPHPVWVLRHDCIKHAYEEFQRVADSYLNGREYIPTNAPVDGVFDCGDDIFKSAGKPS